MDQEEYQEQFDGLFENYYSAGNPKAQLEALETVVRLADSVGDIYGAFDVRMEMIQVATFAGQKDKALVAFTWCLAQSDKYPDEFDLHSLLWRYKWVLGNVPTFLNVSKKKIYDLQDDMQKRLIAAGYNLRPIYSLRWTNAMRMGEFARADEFMVLWKETSRDEMANCEACEQDNLSEYFGQRGKFEQAAETAAKLLDGRMTCTVIPHVTYGHMVPTLLKLGQVDELKQNQSKWYKLIKDNEEFIEPISHHLLLAAGLKQFPQAVAMFERHAPWAAETVNDHDRFAFYNSATAMFKLMAQTESSVKLRVPKEFGCKREDNEYQCAELAEWFRVEAESLAKQFNHRNGNAYYSDLMAEAETLISSI